MIKIKQFTFNLFEEHCRIIWNDSDECIVVDPGFYRAAEQQEFFDFLEDKRLVPQAVLLTHTHGDHVFGVSAIQKRYHCPVFAHEKDWDSEIREQNIRMFSKLGLEELDYGFDVTTIQDNQILDIAGLSFKVIWTPGHTPGGVCYLETTENILFTGDTLLKDCIGRSDFIYSDYDAEIKSILEKLLVLSPDTVILPGHGDDSTIGHELSHNPFLEPFNEPENIADPDATPIIIHG